MYVNILHVTTQCNTVNAAAHHCCACLCSFMQLCVTAKVCRGRYYMYKHMLYAYIGLLTVLQYIVGALVYVAIYIECNIALWYIDATRNVQ